MTKLIFIEGVSGVGKSTMVSKLLEELHSAGYTARAYLEFDYTNPIDFYCTAYFECEEYGSFCRKYKKEFDTIYKNTVNAGKARLIRYFDQDIPLFNEPLLSELMSREFCYKPQNPVSLKKYANVYISVWKNFVLFIDDRIDYIIFDGSLIHHPLNDMIRNYNASVDISLTHVQNLLNTLGKTQRMIFYLKTDDIAVQLNKAHTDRGQHTPTNSQIEFWEKRYKYDMIILNIINEKCKIFDISDSEWDSVRKRIFLDII